jgi:hypothetical protein
MKEIIFITDFFCDDCTNKDVMANISRHCNLTPSDEIWVYDGVPNFYLICFSEDITYPKVTYAESVSLSTQVSLIKILPDIKKIDYFWANYLGMDDFGTIQEIGHFSNMSIFTNSRYRKENNIKTKCERIGKKMYRFTSDKGTWDIKVNKYD